MFVSEITCQMKNEGSEENMITSYERVTTNIRARTIDANSLSYLR